MRTLKIIVATTVLTLGGSLVVMADPWKDDSGHGKHGNGPYWASDHAYGACEVEREWKDDGEYNEKVKCEHDDDYEVYRAWRMSPIGTRRTSELHSANSSI